MWEETFIIKAFMKKAVSEDSLALTKKKKKNQIVKKKKVLQRVENFRYPLTNFQKNKYFFNLQNPLGKGEKAEKETEKKEKSQRRRAKGDFNKNEK